MANSDCKSAAGIFGTAPENRLVDEYEAAARLGLTVATLRRWRWARKGVPWIKVGAAVRYAPADIQTFIETGRHSIQAA